MSNRNQWLALLALLALQGCDSSNKPASTSPPPKADAAVSAPAATAQTAAWDGMNLECLNTLKQGIFPSAEEKCSRSVIEAEKFGAADQRFASSMVNLGVSLQAQKKYPKAEENFLRAVIIQEKVLGPNHAEVGNTLNKLVEAYNAQNKYQVAEPQMRRSLDILEKTQGPDHISVAAGLENLAAALKGLGRATEAVAFEQRAVGIRSLK